MEEVPQDECGQSCLILLLCPLHLDLSWDLKGLSIAKEEKHDNDDYFESLWTN